MSPLPTNWLRAPIGSLCDLKNGRAFKPTEWSQDGLPIVRIQNLNNTSAPFNRFNGSYDHKHYLKGGELLFAWSGTPGTSFGAHAWRGGNALLNQHIFRVDFDDALLDRRFFRHAINQKLTELIGVAHGGAGLQHVTKGVFEGTEVALPPRAEQLRIADKLDTVLTRVDTVNTRLARVGPILKRFRQSVLAAATSGRLTGDWRTTHKAATWTLRTVDSLCLHISDGPFGSNLKSDDYTDDGARVVRLENIGHLSFDRDKKTYVSLAKYETLKKHTLVKGDLLFSSFVDEEVRVCEFPTDISEPTINKADCFCVRADVEQVNQRFLLIRLACKSTYEALKELVHGATRPRINLRQLRGFELRLPSLEEQTEIVLRVEILLDFVDRLEARLQTAQTATERLTPALLAKAFRGELVPQDPNDEPASELLQRLAARAEAPAAQRGRRKVTAAKV